MPAGLLWPVVSNLYVPVKHVLLYLTIFCIKYIFLWAIRYAGKLVRYTEWSGRQQNTPCVLNYLPPLRLRLHYKNWRFLLIAATCKPDCLNGGTCVNGKCVCAAGYKGPNCNIGECIFVVYDSVGKVLIPGLRLVSDWFTVTKLQLIISCAFSFIQFVDLKNIQRLMHAYS